MVCTPKGPSNERLERPMPKPSYSSFDRRAKWIQDSIEALRSIRSAGKVVQRALQMGTLTRPSVCEECGSTGEDTRRPITAAHHDYSKPLDVRWLCWTCHKRWDHASPKIWPRKPEAFPRPVHGSPVESWEPVTIPEGRFSPAPDGRMVKRKKSNLIARLRYLESQR